MSLRAMSLGAPVRALCGAVLWIAGEATLRAEDAGFAGAVPSDVLFFVECANVKALQAEFEASPYWRMLNDPACQPVKQLLDSKLAELKTSLLEETSADVEGLLKAASGRLALYCYMLSEKNLEDPRPQGEEPEAVGLLLDVAEEHEAFVTEFEKLLEKDLAAGKMTREQREVEGIDVAVFVRAEGKGFGEIGYGFVADTFFLVVRRSGSQIDAYSDVIRGLGGGLESTLADNPQFASSLTDEGSDLTMYFDAKGLVKRELARDEALGIPVDGIQRDAMEAIGAFVGSGRFRDGLTDATQRLNWASDSRLLGLLRKAFPVGESRLLSRVPEQAFVAASLQFDVEEFINLVIEIGSESVGQSPADMRTEMEANFEQDGFHVKRDILDNLGGEIAFFLHEVQDETEALPDTEDSPFNFAVLIALKDSQGIETALDAVLRKEGMHAIRERKEFEGKSYFALPTPLGIKAYYALLSDCAVISGSSELMLDVLRRSGKSELPTLATAPGFADALDLAGRELTGFYTVDLPKLFPMFLADAFFDGDPTIEVPSEEVWRKYFTSRDLITGRIDDNGFVLRTVQAKR